MLHRRITSAQPELTSASPPPHPPFCSASGDPDILPQQMLRKYITYAKQMCKPKLQAADYDKIAQVGARLCQGDWWVPAGVWRCVGSVTMVVWGG